jgi:hypothetical protein
MASPVINNISAGMSYYDDAPIVNISCNLRHEDGYTVDVSASGLQYAYSSSPSVWYDVTLHADTTGVDMPTYTTSPGRNTVLKWDVSTDLDEVEDDMLIKMDVVDPSGLHSGFAQTSAFAIKTTDPTVSFTLDDYTTNQTISFTPTASGSPTHYKVSESATLSGATWQTFSGDVSITFATSTEETKNVYLQLRDAYYNTSAIASDSIILHSTGPTSTYVGINGTVADNEYYTGIMIDSTTGAFTPDRTASLDLYAEDLLDIEIYIDGDIEDAANVRQWIPYSTSEDITFVGTDYNYDSDADIQVKFRDAAGNISTVNKTIRVNTTVFQTDRGLLREPSSEYAHQIIEVAGNGTTTILDATATEASDFIRRWDEIFYPSNHDYPRDENEDIDESTCIAMNGVSNASYDAVQLSGGDVYYDSEDRPVTVDWTKDGTKDYDNLESSYSGNMRYWVIDNTGYGDIDITFEHFYINPNSYGPPYNSLAPHDGDQLVIYNASASGCVQESVGPQGDRSYTLLDSSKLVELYAYTGEGNQVMELNSGYTVNANTNGGFSVPTIRGNSRVLLMLYTDASTTSSGFKVKSGPKQNITYNNYDVDETNGEVWIHKYPNGQTSSGTVRMIYDYYDTDISYDLDAGEVIFAVDPSGSVTADYSYYTKEADRITEDDARLFIASTDDFVEYLDPNMYVTPSGQTVNKNANYIHGYPTPVSASGKISSYFTVDKDRGLVEFNDGTSVHSDEFAYVPSGRLTLDYYHHTYKRLSNDGYGTLIFRDSTVVADDTELFPDYTWIDVKFVNEGDATLEDGKLTFLSRGYDNDNDGTIDQVLDVNRPWDIQQGTAEETFEKAAMEASESYLFDSFCTKEQAKTILSDWQDASFGFDVYARDICYGRVVWVLGGTSDSYPSTSVGTKTFSAELEGRYYNIEE